MTVTEAERVLDDVESDGELTGRQVVIYKSAWPFAAVVITCVLCFTLFVVLQGMGYITHKIG